MGDVLTRHEIQRGCRWLIESMELLQQLGIRSSQVEAEPGSLLGLAAFLAEPDCPCGGEHLAMDHAA